MLSQEEKYKRKLSRARARRSLSKFLGRRLGRLEHVHHKDDNPFNNAIDNLEILPAGEHIRLHKKNERPYEGSEKQKETSRAWSLKNRDKMLGYRKAYYNKHKDQVLAAGKEYRKRVNYKRPK